MGNLSTILGSRTTWIMAASKHGKAKGSNTLPTLMQLHWVTFGFKRFLKSSLFANSKGVLAVSHSTEPRAGHPDTWNVLIFLVTFLIIFYSLCSPAVCNYPSHSRKPLFPTVSDKNMFDDQNISL